MVLLQVGEVVKAADGIRGIAVAAGIKKFTANDTHIPVNTHHAHGVIALRANGARNMCAVAVVVHRIAGATDSGKTMHVINNAVAVIIDAITRNFSGVCPDIVRQIRVSVIHT